MPVKYIEQFYEIFLASVGNRTNPSTIKEFTFVVAEEGSADASKRNLISFVDLIYKATRKNPTDFYDYGCYCGLHGKGRPVDKLDR